MLGLGVVPEIVVTYLKAISINSGGHALLSDGHSFLQLQNKYVLRRSL